jgi:hypothetical protein
MLSSTITDPTGLSAVEIPITFQSIDALKKRIFVLETKLTAEQLVVAFLRAEKPAQEYIQKEAESASWRSWLPGMFKSSPTTGTPTQ